MKRYSIFHIPPLSFFSGALYREVCLHWKGSGFGYLLLLLAICLIPTLAKINVEISNSVDKEAPKIISQVPEITIHNGNASIDEPQPYYINDPATGEALAVIDTTGSITSLDQTKALALVNKTETIFKKSDVETHIVSFKDVDHFVLNQDKIYGWLDILKKYAVFFLYPVIVLSMFVSRIIQALIYALIGLLFTLLCRCKRPYSNLIRLSVVAMTPVIIIQTILGAAAITIPAQGLWCFLLAMGYLFFGVKSSCGDKQLSNEPALRNVPREG